MPDRLEIHGASLSFERDGYYVDVNAYCVWDTAADIVRHASLQYRWCEQWISNHRHEYPAVEDDEDDDLS